MKHVIFQKANGYGTKIITHINCMMRIVHFLIPDSGAGKADGMMKAFVYGDGNRMIATFHGM
jgi:hypothetical protein